MESTFRALGPLPFAAPEPVRAAWEQARALIGEAIDADADAHDAAARVRQAEREDREAIVAAARKGRDHLPTVPRFQALADDAQTTARQAAQQARRAIEDYRAARQATYDDPAVRDAWLAEVLAAYEQATAEARTAYDAFTALVQRKRGLANLMHAMTGEPHDERPRHLWGDPAALDREADKLFNEPTWLAAFRQALADTTGQEDTA